MKKTMINKIDIRRTGWSLFILCLLFVGIQSCKENDSVSSDSIPNLGGYKPAGNPTIDTWIKKNLTEPFNVAVKYQYDPFEVDFMKNTTPAKEEYVIPTMELVKQCMVHPYLKNSDSAFVKRIIPKLWVLIGSGQYNDNGTVVLGQDEGGNKITLMDVNKYDKSRQFVQSSNYTVQHETAHILHQTRIFSPQFKYVNPEYYTTTWHNYPDKEAFDLGFVRNYAMASAEEDFVETIAYLLVFGQKAYDDLANKSTPAGKNRLKIKEQLVVEYFKDKWNMDFRQLQVDVQQGINGYIAGNQS